MAGQKTLLNFFQKTTPVKRVLESSTSQIKSPSVSDTNKENEKEEVRFF